jgi:hypothetical protein
MHALVDIVERVLRPGRPRRWWTATALAAVAGLFLLGMLTVAGVTGKVIVL